MSRTERIPAVSPPSMTTRWRKPPRTIATAACSSDQSGAAKTSSDVRWSATRSVSGSCPLRDRDQDVALGDDARPHAVGVDGPRPRRPRGRPSARPPAAACAPARPSGPPCSCPPAPASRRLLRSVVCDVRYKPTPSRGCQRRSLDEGPSAQRASDPGVSGNAPALILRRTSARIDYVPTQRPATVALRTSLFEDATAIVEREYAADLVARRHRPPRRLLPPPAAARLRRDRRTPPSAST